MSIWTDGLDGSMKHGLLCFILTAVALLCSREARAVDWTVTYDGSASFIVTRSSGSGRATVLYRKVSISAMSEKHFRNGNGILFFEDGETTKRVLAAEVSFASVPTRYRYQYTRYLYYGIEVVSQEGDVLASARQTLNSGGDTNNPYYLNGYSSYVNTYISELTYFDIPNVYSMTTKYCDVQFNPPSSYVESSGDFSGYALIDDSWDYSKKPATVNPNYFYVANRAGGNGEWHKLIGNKLYASVCFTEKEKYDGYGYVQILTGTSNAAYDGADPNAEVNTPVNSIYKACFELKKGSGVYSGSGKWIFPHSSDATDNSKYNGNRDIFWMNDSYLWQQKFRSESYRAGGGNNAFILDPDIGSLTVRFDCGGSGDDTYGYKDLFVRFALLDETAPTVLKDEITVSPGPHLKGNNVTINVPFSEPVTFSDESVYTLNTTWGDFLVDYDCIGSNVLSFSGEITANTGTQLRINSLSITPGPYQGTQIYPIKDLLNHQFTGNTINKTLSNYTVDQLYNISYDLAGGSMPVDNLTKYTASLGPFTLVNPTRLGYTFTGWTGTDLNGPTMSVTIPFGATGNRSYTATWSYNGGLVLSYANLFGEMMYVTTFYDSTNDYRLPEGAMAYTVSLDGGREKVVLHQIGDDGRVIPHGTGVVVVANTSYVDLTKISSTSVRPHDGNVLHGTDTEIPLPDGEAVYVLNIKIDRAGNRIPGFYLYNGPTIPARKAYYSEVPHYIEL